MSIKLEVEEYCQNCKNFVPDVDVNDQTMYCSNGNYYSVVDTIITCKRRDNCKCIYEFIKSQKG